MEWLIALILGFVEGATEFLPVSSTAHLILLARMLGFDDPSGAFKVMIQLGAILALLTLYFGKVFGAIRDLPTSEAARRFALSVVLGFLPAAIAGVLLGDFLDKVFLEGRADDNALRIIATTLMVGGVVMLLVEQFAPVPTDRLADQLPWWKSLVIGCFQALALIPGVSRSGATIVGAMAMGVERRAAAEYSFFLAMPTMAGAFVYKVWQDKDQLDFSQLGTVGIGFVAAFIAAALVVKAFLAIVSRYGFLPFALYRVVLGGLIFLMVGFA